MRRELVRALRQRFRSDLESQTKFVKIAADAYAPDSDVYRWTLSKNLNGFVRLVWSSKAYRDEFMIELAWSAGPSYPPPAPIEKQRGLDPRNDGRIRLPDLWRDRWSSALQLWWELGPRLGADTGDEFYADEETQRRVARVPEVVADAIQKLEEFGIPFLLGLAAKRE